jgi:hypothetical protein
MKNMMDKANKRTKREPVGALGTLMKGNKGSKEKA